jgi:hypothetical protein
MKKSARLEIFIQWNHQDVKMLQSEIRKQSIPLWRYSQPPECCTWRYKYHLYICVWHYGSTQAEQPGGSFMLQRYIAYGWGTPQVGTKPPVCPAADQFPLCFYFLWINFKKLYRYNRGTEKSETTSRLLLKSYSIGLKAYLAHISGDTVPLMKLAAWALCL